MNKPIKIPSHVVKDSNKEFLKLVSSMQQITNTSNTSNIDKDLSTKKEKQK